MITAAAAAAIGGGGGTRTRARARRWRCLRRHRRGHRGLLSVSGAVPARSSQSSPVVWSDLAPRPCLSARVGLLRISLSFSPTSSVPPFPRRSPVGFVR